MLRIVQSLTKPLTAPRTLPSYPKRVCAALVLFEERLHGRILLKVHGVRVGRVREGWTILL